MAYERKFVLPSCHTGSIPVEQLCLICLNAYVAKFFTGQSSLVVETMFFTSSRNSEVSCTL